MLVRKMQIHLISLLVLIAVSCGELIHNLDDDCWILNNTVLYVLGAAKGTTIFLKGGNDFSHQFKCNVAISTENRNQDIYVSVEVKKNKFLKNEKCASYIQIENEIFCNETRKTYTSFKGSRFIFLYHKNNAALIISICAKIDTQRDLDVTTPAPSDDNGLQMPSIFSIVGAAVGLTLFVVIVIGWICYSYRRSTEVEQNGNEEVASSTSSLLEADDSRSEEAESDDSRNKEAESDNSRSEEAESDDSCLLKDVISTY